MGGIYLPGRRPVEKTRILTDIRYDLGKTGSHNEPRHTLPNGVLSPGPFGRRKPVRSSDLEFVCGPVQKNERSTDHAKLIRQRLHSLLKKRLRLKCRTQNIGHPG